MTSYNLEDVFKTTGIPTVTYVEPPEYTSLIIAIRTKGKCVVVEGPSGIGKTTAVVKVLDNLKIDKTYTLYSARNPSHINSIQKIADGDFTGTVIIDDFHRLNADFQEKISDIMKIMADTSDESRKIIVIGINKVGDSLVHFSPDLNNRISTIRFEANPEEKIQELIHKGEEALNFEFDSIGSLVEHSSGSFHIVQLMCQKACIRERILETCSDKQTVHFSYPNVLAEMSEELSRSFFNIAREFSTGPKLRREGRAPYLHVLKWLSSSDTWSIDLTLEMQKHPQHKAGVTQIVEKGYLEKFLNDHTDCASYIHYDKITRILSVEDPKLMFYLKSLNWNNFAKDIGYEALVEEPKYDYALSFAGTERPIVEKVFLRLEANEIAVFYDKNEQADILSMDVEEYLYPIYNSEAAYVVPFLSKEYPKRVWTRFESKAFKDRFGNNSVIPIWFDDVDETMFDNSKQYGGITYQTNNNIDDEVEKIVNLLIRKIAQYRQKK